MFKHFPQKEETDDLTGSACLQGHNTAIGQMKGRTMFSQKPFERVLEPRV